MLWSELLLFDNKGKEIAAISIDDDAGFQSC
jgi:hypothetical protein